MKEAYVLAPGDIVILHTLKLRHPGFKDALGKPTASRVVRDYQDHTCVLEDSAPLDAGQTVL